MSAALATVKLAGEVQAMRPELLVRVVHTRVDMRAADARIAREGLEQLGPPLLRAAFYARKAIPYAFTSGMGINSYEPRGLAHCEVIAIADELLELCGEGRKPAKRAKRKTANG
jgi:cellulose biosynthesis protein BcsQ